VLGSNRLWRMSQSAWVETFERCLEAPDRSRLIRANVVFDFRHVAGGLQIVPPLVAVMRTARGHPDFIRQIARTATDAKVPLGFRGQLVHDATVDIKRGGSLPIANLARFFALANGITISATLDRLAAATEVGALDDEVGAALQEAFVAIMRVRLEHQARCIAEGRPPDNLVRPDAMTPLTRTQLREALRVVAHAQKRLNVYVPLGL
jgi:CBS domain-containing protein